VFGALMAWAFDARLHDALSAAGVPADVVSFVQNERAKLAAAALPPHIDPAVADATRRALGEAFVAGYRWIMLCSAALALGSAALAAAFVHAAAPSRARSAA
jgi:hypothetical protein